MAAFAKGIVDTRYLVYDLSMRGAGAVLVGAGAASGSGCVMASASQPSPANRASERRTAERIAASASSLFLFAILVMVNYLAFRHYQRFDWTSQGLFTLSAEVEDRVARA